MNHHVNSRKKATILCFLQKLRTLYEVALSHLQRLEDLMHFFLPILIPGQHSYFGAHVDTRDQSSGEEYEPACFHMTQPSGFSSPGAAVGSHSCLTSGMEQASLPSTGLR